MKLQKLGYELEEAAIVAASFLLKCKPLETLDAILVRFNAITNSMKGKANSELFFSSNFHEL
jgi:hypothetical protein